MIKQFEKYSDGELIERVLGGEQILFEVLVRRYNSFLYKIARSYAYNHEDAEDLMQETYISAYFSLQQFANRSSFKTWLTRIMLNQCYHKKQKLSFRNESLTGNPLPEEAQAMFQDHSNTEKEMMHREFRQVLENALLQIPEEYRLVFTSRELNALSVAETAEAFRISESNVKVRLNRAKKMLRSEIEKMYPPEEIFEFNLVHCDKMVERVMNELNRINERTNKSL